MEKHLSVFTDLLIWETTEVKANSGKKAAFYRAVQKN